MPKILINLDDWGTPEILTRKDSIIAGVRDAIMLLGDSRKIVSSFGLRPIPARGKPKAAAIRIELSDRLIEGGTVGTFSQETWIATNDLHTDVRIEAKNKTLQLLKRIIIDRAEILEKSAAVLRDAQLKSDLIVILDPPPATPSSQQQTCEPTCPSCGHTGKPVGPRAYTCPNCQESFGIA